ncbi:hypothetical protein [Mucilaginibacter rubeus]|uniref:hypothetical protein n=1 Tax=Mucilaginibacter rubeus TaxID=2027860 RepID=UPI003391ACC7
MMPFQALFGLFGGKGTFRIKEGEWTIGCNDWTDRIFLIFSRLSRTIFRGAGTLRINAISAAVIRLSQASVDAWTRDRTFHQVLHLSKTKIQYENN